MGFSSFNFDPKITAGIHALGYTKPTPIQAQAIGPVMQGRDVMGLAQTGTGKTAAFALPILQRLLKGPRSVTRALILAPTRELADQIQEAFRGLGRQTGLRSLTVYGGVGFGPQVSGLRNGMEIVVACPGRLLVHLQNGIFKPAHVEVLVIDEVDRLFDMGFMPDIRKILKRLPPHRQTLLFSATMPEDIRKLSHEVLRQPVTVQVDHAVPLATVSHALYPVAEHLKTALLSKLLAQDGKSSVLIFTRTKHRAKRLFERLQEQGLAATCLQGNLSQSRRKSSLDGFREGRYNIMVATDIASRGIDISQITHVINFDVPDTTEAYTHRIGRTGRAAKTGDAFTFVTPQDEGMVRDIERVMRKKLERRQLKDFDYSAKQSAAPAHASHAPHHQGHGHAPHHAHHGGHAAGHPHPKASHAGHHARPAHSSGASGQPGQSEQGKKPAGGFHGYGRFSRFHSRARRPR